MAATGDAQERRTHVPAAAQGLLFDDDLPELSEDIGYRGPTACRAAGITYRQLDYWARTGLVEPSVRRREAGRRLGIVEAVTPEDDVPLGTADVVIEATGEPKNLEQAILRQDAAFFDTLAAWMGWGLHA